MDVDPSLCPDPSVLRRASPAPASTLVIFGANGDLTKRLLLPSLYNLTGAGLLPEGFGVIGLDHNERDDETYRRQFFTQITTELEHAVGVRAVYRALR